MTPSDLSELLKRSELRTLDFKLVPYDFGGATREEKIRKRSAFAKDIISMANTPREESAYIVIGVKRNLDGSNELKSVQGHTDDNVFQQQLEGLIYPPPRFQYEQVELNGVQLGVIEILPDRAIGPFLPKFDTVGPGCMRRNVLYWRRGTQNAEAGQAEQRAIHHWFHGNTPKLPDHFDGDGGWERFVQVADITELGRQYLLILAPGEAVERDVLRHLAWVDWNLVMDLDPESESNGVLKQCKADLEKRRPVYRVTKGDDIFGNVGRATFWYFCRGLTGRSESFSLGSYAEWNKAYGEDLRRKLVKFAAGSSDPVVIIALWSSSKDDNFVRRIIETSASIFGERMTSVVVTEDETQCAQVAEATGSTLCQISTRHFLEGLATMQALRDAGADNVVRLPGCDGVPKTVPSSDLAWFEEDLEIVHLGIGQSLPAEVDPDRDFLRGGAITWFGLGFGADVERDKLTAVMNCVRRDLEHRRSKR